MRKEIMMNFMAKRTLLLMFGVLVLAASAGTKLQSAIPPDSKSDEAARAAALKVDEEFNEAVRTKDRVTLERVLADDLSWVARGDRLNKAQVISDVMSENLHFKMLTHDSIQVKIFDNTAVVTGHSTSILEYKGQLFTAPRLFTSVYMNLNGQWQLVAHQVTDLVEKK
ncbi:MAG TPA: nuclear transport factor 2 family protein [Candidatus Acidoferrales bacterium]|nr:nuclear transport factor 2 family protein [Candidatus Acidoferrales bacterium]